MTSTPFSGNATPVLVLSSLDEWLPESSMQLIARELNHSETVFVRRRLNCTPNTYDIRFFTPYAEEPFCGHGILGAAHALHLSTGLTTFEFVTAMGIDTRASVSTTSQTWANDEDTVSVSMHFPCSPVVARLQPSLDVKTKFAAALGLDEVEILQIGMNDLMDIVLELNSEVDFSAENMAIDAVALLKASPPGTRSQVITSSWAFDDDVDFAKRVFAYGSEDQATGSTYCALVPYWGEKLQKAELKALQPSWRGGSSLVRWDQNTSRIEIIAESVKTIDGRIKTGREQMRGDGPRL
ncbi:Diaminopimelate epimerase-like protein [Cadophora sp. DSE1049]|nr:Diaminopimelate epimerase-like protein [Cadophora sp. DSE1049]